MKPVKKRITIVSPCYNEAANIEELYRRIISATSALKEYEFECLFIDNASTDGTQEKLRKLANQDNNVKVIINTRNFGHLRSPYWGLLQSFADATICLASDLQDPPELIPLFIEQWEKGYKVVLATKPVSNTNFFVHTLRKFYYGFLDRISDVSHIKNATGFGLFEKVVIDKIRIVNDPYPYFRGLIVELGYVIKTIDFEQPRRIRGVSKNNFYTLYDFAMLGITSHSKLPIRIASFMGFGIGILSILTGLIFFGLKLFFWDSFDVGVAPIIIGMFFLFGLMFLFIGILGEYIGSIHTYLQNRPIVVEKERINFD
jgi:glycosyltransferase involved in cell wall biosynthesis